MDEDKRMTLSKHAEARCAERGIPPLIIDWLERFGAHEHDKRGCCVVWFDKRSRCQLEREVGRQVVKCVKPLLDAYAVVSTAGEVVTVGWRSKRITRH
jgi:hypothetical protein